MSGTPTRTVPPASFDSGAAEKLNRLKRSTAMSQSTITPTRKAILNTGTSQFFAVRGNDIFNVVDGVPIADLLERVQCFLETSCDVLVPICEDRSDAFAAKCMLELSCGMLEAVVKTLNALERQQM
jgi:hypothetical protein